jgi:AbrB family looped-hinge helix DNA binding protein
MGGISHSAVSGFSRVVFRPMPYCALSALGRSCRGRVHRRAADRAGVARYYCAWYYREVRITSKGQVTIPQEIREELGLLPNTEVSFDIVDGEARLRKARKKTSARLSRGDVVVQRLRAVRPSNKLTTDEIMALMRGKR